MERQELCGYHETLFIVPPPFLCTLCFSIPKTPVICKTCKCMYCTNALNAITRRCITCQQNTFERPDGATMMTYNNSTMFCPMCSQTMTLVDYEKHGCVNPKIPCRNAAICKTEDISKGQFVSEGVCGPACLLTLMYINNSDPKNILETIRRMMKDPRVAYTSP